MPEPSATLRSRKWSNAGPWLRRPVTPPLPPSAMRATPLAPATLPSPRLRELKPSELQKQQAVERTQLENEPAQLDDQIASLERANNESQVAIGEASAAEREAEQALLAASSNVSNANERFADARERRAAAAARAEAQQARSTEFAHASVEKFECVP